MNAATNRGYTVAEFLVGLTLAALIGSQAQSVLHTALRDARAQQSAAEARAGASAALEMLAREIRAAGFSARGDEVVPFAAARSDRLELRADFDGDGLHDSSHERITWAYRATDRQLTRASGRGSAQSVAVPLTANGFRLAYRDANGGVLPVGASGVAPDALASIRQVDIEVSVATSSAAPLVRSLVVAVRSPT